MAPKDTLCIDVIVDGEEFSLEHDDVPFLRDRFPEPGMAEPGKIDELSDYFHKQLFSNRAELPETVRDAFDNQRTFRLYPCERKYGRIEISYD